MGGHTSSSDRSETVGATGTSRFLDKFRKRSEAWWAFALWGYFALAVLQLAFCLLSISPDSPPPSGPILFAITFVASLAIVSMLHQLRVTRALLAEIDDLRSRIEDSGDRVGDQPSSTGRPPA
jgi:hypothetical protein